ncbi:MAG: hypothetical protein ACP5P2_00585 [Candidatus Micrarchaeia archaeon]|jgi:transcription initiation factor IIE alpha subunit
MKRIEAAKKKVSAKHAPRPKKVAKKIAKKVSAKQSRIKAKAKLNEVKSTVVADHVKIIDEMVNDKDFSNYIIKNVGKRAFDILSALHEPLSDEELASKLDIKINEVRRILNTLNTYGITKYDTLKDKNGWLIFKWYINTKNIENAKKNILESTKISKYKLPEECNDFFVCDTCFEKRKVLFPFDTAVEMKFKCDCGGNLIRISKEEAQRLIEEGGVSTH